MRALAGEWSLAGASEVEGEAEADPVLIVEDALRHFPADEILLAGGALEDGGVEAALRRFGLPVTRLRQSVRVRERSVLREAIRGLARGRSRATPFVLFTGVNLTLLVLAALITLVVLLVLLVALTARPGQPQGGARPPALGESLSGRSSTLAARRTVRLEG